MSSHPDVSTRTIEVEQDFLPYPATNLVVTQHLQASREDPPFWAWIIVGAFYDSNDTVLWSTQIFVAHLDIEFESDTEEESETSDAESLGGQASPAASSPFVEEAESLDSFDDGACEEPIHDLYHLTPSNHNSQRLLPPASTLIPQQPSGPYSPSFPPGFWDPSAYSQAPGHWLASFDHSTGLWIHTWQSTY
jgi:hypothetical protein